MPDDDNPVSDETLLYRRLHPTQVVWDENRGGVRATSNAFKDPELSIALGDELSTLDRDPSWVLRMDPLHQLGAFTADFARGEEQTIRRDPLVGHERYGDDPTHGAVEGAKPKTRRNRFVAACEVMLLQPDALSEDLRARLEQQF